jgi:YVTN family beta-propeller protein
MRDQIARSSGLRATSIVAVVIAKDLEIHFIPSGAARPSWSSQPKKASMFKSAVLTASIFLGTLCTPAQTTFPFTLQRTIQLPGVVGKFDHFAIDLPGHRLFVSATGNHSVEVIDLATNRVSDTITGLGKPHGLAWVAGTRSLYIADGALAELRLYRGAPLKLIAKIKLSEDADDMVLDEADHSIYVGHGGTNAANPGRIARVDLDTSALVSDIPAAAHPEALDIDLSGQRIFANIADAGEVAVVDPPANALAAHWKLHNASDNVPMAYDPEDGLLFIACRTPAMLLALDGASGVELTRLPTGSGADDLFYDAALHRVYVIAGVGEVHTYQLEEGRHLRPLPVLATAPGAKTALFVPSQSLLYVGVPAEGVHPAEIRIFEAHASKQSKAGSR